jgi:type IV pilus assembly protein PilY1
MRQSKIVLTTLTTAWLVFSAGVSAPVRAQAQAAPLPISEVPLYLAQALPPLNMLVMGKDHKNYYEAYNDTADLNGDGAIDVGYKPDVIDYYGYFNSKVCYVWNSGSNRFDPSVATNDAKQCSGAADWSGDFLNYLTTGRFDALRKVLYGGYRAVDTTTETVLQGAFFPQDGHSWGKEYKSIDRDGYDISLYSPLSQPEDSRFHLFAVTTVTDNSAPLFRVLEDSPYRIWNWVSIEGPVANNRCFNASNQRVDCVGVGTTPPHPGHPTDRASFDTMEATYGTAGNQFGAVFSGARIDCDNNDCNLRSTQEDNFMSIAVASFQMRSDSDIANGDYEFCIDGDDAIDLEIRNASGTVIASAGWYGGHGFGNNCDAPRTTGTVALARGEAYTIKFRHEEASGGEGYRLQWRKTGGSRQFGWEIFARGDGGDGNGGNRSKETAQTATNTNFSFRFYNLTPANAAIARADYAVRVLTCPSTAALREDNCKAYTSGGTTVYKPTGLLHDFGETNRMYFGLLTGSQRNNLQGGVLRRNLSSFADEVNPDTGEFRTNVDGIVRSLDRFRMIGGGYANSTTDNTSSDSNWAWGNGTGNCPSIGNRAINNGECRMWGNPIGEMMFETLRYYAGAAAPTAAYSSGGASQGTTEETTLGLTTETWKDPYETVANGGIGYLACAKPVMTVISDVNPSYDSSLPGNPWDATAPAFTLPTTISDFNVATVGQAMWNQEFGSGSRSVFIGQVGTTTSDGAPTSKSASSFGTIRGLAPEEPTKGGSYSSAAVASYAWTKTGRVNTRSTEKLRTYAVALASPLPIIQFPVNGQQLTFVPFAKTAGGTFGGGPQYPTNTIVDFYIEQFVNLPGQEQDPNINEGRPYAIFRINYEDVEQGNDHDMDAIVRYEFRANANGTVTVNLNSEYAAGSARQNMGYIANGTTTDGIYLEVRDFDTSAADSPANIFNTPPGRNAGYCNVNPFPSDCALLPLTATRVFTPGGNAEDITPLRDPLWYAAKYGGFSDTNSNNRPDLQAEWDANSDGKPDNYFLVTNALTLKEELAKAFSQIERDARPSGGVAASGARRDGEFLAYVPEYNADDWTGDLRAYPLNADGTLADEAWSAEDNLPDPDDRDLFVMINNSGVLEPAEFTVDGLGGSTAAVTALGLTTTALATDFGAGITIDDVVEYLRGDQSNEIEQGGVFRDRSRRLGDILGSQPEVLGRGSQGYTGLPAAMGGGATGAGTYGEFVRDVKLTRDPVVFVGANDGMLHAFDGSNSADGGTELFAIAPNGSLGKMGRLLSPKYEHTFFVDAPPAQGDAYLGGQWKTIVAAASGAGSKSILVLDATDAAASFDATNILYEIQNNALGHVLGRGRIILAEDGRWYALFGNGLNSASNQSGIILIDLETGAVRSIMTGLGTAADTNGMGSVAAVDADGDLRVDTVYGGDYHGRVWKFDLSSATASAWNVAYAGQPLFVATNSSGGRQQITGSVDVANHFQSGYMVYTGSGRYVLQGDGVVPLTPPVDTFYAVWDNLSARISNGRSDLQAQTITSQVSITDVGVVRTSSRNPIDWTSKRGWFMDLRVQDGTSLANGERFIGEPRVALGRVLFTTFIPIGDQCAPGGVNWLYSLNSISGAPQLGAETAGGGTGALSITPPGGSAPPSTAPPIVITPPGPREDNDGGDGGGGDDQEPPPPPCEGDDCPPPCVGDDCPCVGDDCPPTDPPPPSRGGRDCKADLGVLTADGIKTFSSVDCGRQSWRQIE